MSKKVEKIDCNGALDLFIHDYNNGTEIEDKKDDDDMDIDEGEKKVREVKKELKVKLFLFFSKKKKIYNSIVFLIFLHFLFY